METGKTRCRQCLLREMLDPAEYERTVERVRRTMNPRLRTPDEEYEARLALCRACDQLQNGTCMLCGCMVEMRAMRRDSHCPTPRRRW
jgi:hypothetical protein